MVNKEERIYVKTNELNELAEKYSGYDIEGEVIKRLEYYNKKPFNDERMELRIEEIKDSIFLYNREPEEEQGYKQPQKDDEKSASDIFTRRGQILSFHKSQQFFYDNSQIFWMWDNNLNKYNRSDETDLLNSIQKELGIETINGKSKAELISGFKQVGRINIPEPFKKTWVQFKDVIYNWEDGKHFPVNPKYFSKNSIPWKVGKSEDTPKIDKLFEEWVGKENKKQLYEFVAYFLSQEKFMQRVFAFVGGGSNGKGTFIKIVQKFLGKENYVASEMKALSENQFESSNLYGKLLCVMGEVSYDDLRNTNMLKKISGEDELSFQFKGKDSFTEMNTCAGVCLTNSLPQTPDKTRGFYRKWIIVDFPNQFNTINKSLLDNIPDKEFENLAFKSMRILKELSKKPNFTNEGNFDERERRYEERSNPVMKFIEDDCEECADGIIQLREFTNLCNEYLKEKHLRILTAIQIGKILRNEGYSVGKRKIGDISAVVILNLKVKTTRTTRTTQISSSSLRKESSSKMGSLGSLGSFQAKNQSKLNGENAKNHSEVTKEPDFTDEEIIKSGHDPKEIRKLQKEIDETHNTNKKGVNLKNG